MLKQRIITALVLVSFVFAALLASQAVYWQILINVVIAVGFWEWLRFAKISSIPLQLFLYSVFFAICAVLQLAYVPMPMLVMASCALWLALIVFTLSEKLDVLHHPFLKVIIGIAVLSISGLIVIELKSLPHGPAWVLCFLVSVWAADVGAYFVGRRFGKTKLAPKVSPGKTVEGLLGGVAFALLIFVPILLNVFEGVDALRMLVIIVATVLVSVMGDLFESKLKRHADLKVSSQVLPGHGGVLDRIDSLLSGAPFFALGLIWLGYW